MSRVSDLPVEVRTLIAQHIDIPDEPPDNAHFYMTSGSRIYRDPFLGHVFDSLYDECKQRAEFLDGARRMVIHVKESTDFQRHYERLKRIQNTPGLSFEERSLLLSQEWNYFTTKNQQLVRSMQIFDMHEAILNRRLAQYRQQNIYAV